LHHEKAEKRRQACTKIQSIRVNANADGITGFFTLTFDGETTELIAHDADADGDESIEMKLEQLSTVGDVEVSREYSWASVPTVEFNLSLESKVLSKAGGTGNLIEIFAAGDVIHVGEEVHVVASVDASFLNMVDPYAGLPASAVNIHRWSFGTSGW
jgi:hypothetical protein